MNSHPAFRIVLLGGLGGFEIVAGITSIVGLDSTVYSVAMRSTVASLGLALVLLHAGRLMTKHRLLAVGFCCFWYIYSLRIAYSTTVDPASLGFPAWYYWSWAIGACAVPMIALSLWNPLSQDAKINFMALFITISLGGGLAAFGASSVEVNSNNELVDTGRLQLTSLNPILLGQLGTSILILSVWAASNPFRDATLISRLAFSATALVGGGLLIGSNSRGPLVSAAMCLLFLVAFSSRRVRLYAITVTLLTILSFIPATKFLEENYGFTTYTRLFEQSQLTEENTLDRLDRFGGAFESFFSNPVTGGGLEEPVHGGYPHNIFAEAFMSTGMMGGFLLLSLMALTTLMAIRVFSLRPTYGWASLLFIQNIVAAQFSGSIYTVNYLWLAAGMVIALHASLSLREGLGLPTRYNKQRAALSPRSAGVSHHPTSASRVRQL